MAWPDDVLAFWFVELEPENWFRSTPELDQRISDRFAATHTSVMALPVEACLADHRTALACIIVLDQFSRNMFRGTPAAFASDAKALTLSERSIELGFDTRLTEPEREFLYMPHMHSEDAAVHVRSLALFKPLADQDSYKSAVAHKAIIDRFGRYPHRNVALGRSSTDEEVAFLKTPNSSF